MFYFIVVLRDKTFRLTSLSPSQLDNLSIQVGHYKGMVGRLLVLAVQDYLPDW